VTDCDREIFVEVQLQAFAGFNSPRELLCFLRDVSESVYSDRLLEFFSYAERSLDTTLNFEMILSRALAFAVEHLSDWAAYYSVQGGRLQLEKSAGELPPSEDPQISAATAEALRTGMTRFSPTLVAIPVRRQNELCGVLGFGLRRRKPVFNRIDLAIAEELGSKINALIERATLYKKLEEMTEAALASNQAKTYFLANVSHEIRTPLGAILGFVELFFGPDQSADARDLWKEKIYKNAHHLLRIIDDILDLSKVEAGRLDVVKEDLDLAWLLSNILDTFEPRAREKGVALRIIFETPIPHLIRSDSTRLNQILCNLIGNAIKFTNKGSVEVRISYARQTLSFAISDTGPGIPHDQVERLFQPFSQSESSHTRRFGGTGLGLALSKRLAHKLDGDIQLTQTTLGQGSTFTATIKIPAMENIQWMTALIPPSSPTVHPTAVEYRLEGKKILVVDDSEDNQFLLSNFLTGAGAQVLLAADGQEAIEHATKSSFDVILMDLQMPVKDGYTATRELRAAGYAGTIIALTACAMKEEQIRCFEAGCDFHLTKPVSRNELLFTVHRHLKPLMDFQRIPRPGPFYNG
jgi:signal transduction histidine kinase/CheY-like chemotaxis protein